MNEEIEQLILMSHDMSLTEQQRRAACFAIEMLTTTAAQEIEDGQIAARCEKLESEVSDLKRNLLEYQQFAGLTELAYRTLCSKVSGEALPIKEFRSRQGGDPAKEESEVPEAKQECPQGHEQASGLPELQQQE